MNIIVCTGVKNVKEWFSPLERSRKYSLTLISPDELQGRIKVTTGQYLLYLDISSFSSEEWKKQCKQISKKENLRVAIIDPKQTIKDPGELFHIGAVDYINRTVLSEDFQTKRMTAALNLCPFSEEQNHEEHTLLGEGDWIPAPRGWKEIQNGREYTFFFLYVEINMLDEWKKKSGSTHIGDIQEVFHHHIESTIKPLGGRIWMWMNNGGVVLFPFKGSHCPCIEACLRLILNRHIISIEEYTYNSLITYTMAVHLGNTIYKTRGQTGEIVSDSVNFLFHVGKKFARREQFYVTENVFPFIEPGFKDLFMENGTFEGVRMYTSKLPKK